VKDPERLQLIIDQLLISRNAFAKSIGVSTDTVYNILKGKTAITANLVKKITDVYTNVRAEWVLKGEGAMLKWQTSDKPLGLNNLEEPVKNYGSIKKCYDDCQAELTRARAKLEKYENEGCPRCAEKEKFIQYLQDQLKERGTGDSRDYRAPDEAANTG